jgi:hypothetical protein
MEQTNDAKPRSAHKKEADEQALPGFIHESNPFKSAIGALKKLTHYNLHTFIGVFCVNIASAILMIVTVVSMLLAVLAFFLQNDPYNLGGFLHIPDEIIQFAYSFDTTSIVTTWIVGLIMLVAINLFMQVLQITLAVTSANQRSITFGRLCKQAISRIFPTLGLFALIIGCMLGGCIVMLLLSRLIGPIAFALLGLIVAAVAVGGVRLLFAWFAVVEGMGPIEAAKYSWRITRNHYAEVVGILAVGGIIVMVPTIILTLLSAIAPSAIVTALSLIMFILGFGVVSLTVTVLAERYVQLVHIDKGLAQATKTDGSNYLAIIAYAAIVVLMSAISSVPAQQGGPEQSVQDELQHQTQNLQNSDPNTSAPDYNYNFN